MEASSSTELSTATEVPTGKHDVDWGGGCRNFREADSGQLPDARQSGTNRRDTFRSWGFTGVALSLAVMVLMGGECADSNRVFRAARMSYRPAANRT
jgi:hypothetical protein